MYEATLPFFSQYGRLETGLQKLEFRRPKSHHSDDKNLGLHPLCPRGQQVEKDDDLIWKASCIMDQLERFEEKARTPIKPAVDGYTSFGQTPSVPWLDVVMKERVKDILADESSSVSNSVVS